MSLFSSLIIDPVVRQARRFSAASPPSTSDDDRGSLSHVNRSFAPPHPPPSAALRVGDGDGEAESTSAVLDEDFTVAQDLHEGSASVWRRATEPTAPIDIPADNHASMSSNPSHNLQSQLRQLHLDSPLPAPPPTTNLQSPVSTASAAATQHAPTMSESLPADDGMRHLRARIHQIRELGIADTDKARMMHGLMTERYNFLRPTSPSSFVSHDRPFTPTSGQSTFSDVHISSPASAASEIDPENPFSLRPGDTEPTYRSLPANYNAEHPGEEEDDAVDEDVSFGCQHYKRNVKVQCFECRRWYTCRHCHDAVEDHNLNRVRTQNMLCMACGTPQKAGEYCIQCGMQAACYYCDTCKLWDNNSNKKIYHCVDCGICRRGAGLGKDYVHCKSCNVCISIAHATSHKCIERATDCDCPICGEWLFNSSTAVVSMPCGHYLHKGCYNQYMETAYKCPTCKKSAVNMELQWQKLTQAIESQPMPEQFADTRAVVQCNDCSARSSVKYHWLGNKCNTCDSYNTNELRILNGPQSEQTANAFLDAEVDIGSGARSPMSVSSPAPQPLRSPRYYFQPDEPEQTWLPGQLPSFPFQMPQMPQFRGMPQFPGMPQLPVFPQMPQMPDAYEMLERVRRSFDHYLNPTGEIRNEDVPIIDLDEERREMQATDGTTVRLPSLPQYVLERFNQSITPLRNYLTPTTEVPSLDLTNGPDPDGLQFWGEDGGRLHRSLSRSGNDEDDEEGSSSEESADEEEDDEDDGDAEDDENEFQLPGHR